MPTSGTRWHSLRDIEKSLKFSAIRSIYRRQSRLEQFGAGLRNAGGQNGVGNNDILEFPTSPFLTGKVFCTSQSDGNRRDNSPNTAGEVSPNGPDIGKISCMDQELIIPGLRLPV